MQCQNPTWLLAYNCNTWTYIKSRKGLYTVRRYCTKTSTTHRALPWGPLTFSRVTYPINLVNRSRNAREAGQGNPAIADIPLNAAVARFPCEQQRSFTCHPKCICICIGLVDHKCVSSSTENRRCTGMWDWAKIYVTSNNIVSNFIHQ